MLLSSTQRKFLFKRLVLTLFALWTIALAYKVKNPQKEHGHHHDEQIHELKKKEAPDFTLSDLQGQKHTLSSYKGKWVVLNFFATWCPPCRDEMPEFVEYAQAHKELIFLGINLREEKGKVESFTSQYKIPFPVLLDENGEVSHLYKVRAIPVTIIIDPEGKVKVTYVGKISPKYHFDREIYAKEPEWKKKKETRTQ